MRRYNRQAYEELLEKMWLLQDGICKECHKKMPKPSERVHFPVRERPTLDHAFGNPDDDREIEAALHQHCNVEKSERLKREAMAYYRRNVLGHQREKKLEANAKELETMLPRFKIVPRDIDSYSNKKHEEAVPIYRQYWFARVIEGFKHQQAYESSMLSAGGCEMAGIELVTAYRQNARMLGPVGPCEEMDEGELSGGAKTGKQVVVFKDASYYYLTVNELEELFPLEGQRAVSGETSTRLLAKAYGLWEAAEKAKTVTKNGRQETDP